MHPSIPGIVAASSAHGYKVKKVLPIPNFSPETIAISGTKAYLAADPNGITIVDISNPLNPQIVGGFQNDGHHPYYQVAVVGNTMYAMPAAPVVLNDDGVFYVVDVSNPAAPVVLGQLTDARLKSLTEGIAVKGNTVFIGSQGNSSVVAIDVTDPTTPAIIGELIDATYLLNLQQLVIKGNYLYTQASDFSTSDGFFTVVDITDPTNMAVVAHVALTNGPTALVVSGNRAYVSLYSDPTSAFGGVAAIDITTPTAPSLLGTLLDPSLLFIFGGDVSGTKFWAALNSSPSPPGGVVVVDVSDPTNMKIVKIITDPALDTGEQVVISGAYAFAVSGFEDTGGKSLLVISVPQ